MFQCQSCKRIEQDTSKLHAHHIKEAEKHPELFWDEDNLETQCEHCHNSDKQRQERGKQLPWQVDEDGWPIAR